MTSPPRLRTLRPARFVVAAAALAALAVALAPVAGATETDPAPSSSSSTATTSTTTPAGGSTTSPTSPTNPTTSPTTPPTTTAPVTTTTPPAPEPGLIEAPHVPSEVIVKYTAAADDADRAAARSLVGAVDAAPVSELSSRTELIELPPGKSVAGAIAQLSADPDVRFAEPNYILTPTVVSNDPQYTSGALWGMYGDTTTPTSVYGSQAAEAWAAGYTGSRNAVVVVIDEGIDFSHPDLAANIWTNPLETVNGVDDDGNGFVDDIHGWDFANNDNTIYDAGGDAHGTHVSGTIGGVGGNGVGVAGVNWNVTIASAKFLNPTGGTTANAVRAVDYATMLKTRYGVNVVSTSNSWGGGGYSQTLLDAINRGGDAGILFVAAAGNSNSDNDAVASYPSNYQCTRTAAGASRGWDCVIAVAAIASNGTRASFSSYGATNVDLGAPGVGVVSTTPGNTYSSYSGTSMATPHVSGAVALCASINPALRADEIRNAVLRSAAPTSALAGATVTGGRLDVGAMVAQCAGSVTPVTGAPSGLTATALTSTSVRLDWTDGTTGETYQEIQQAPVVNAACGTFATAATVGPDLGTTTINGLTAATSYCFRVRAGNSYTGTGGSATTAWAGPTTVRTLDPPPDYRCAGTTYAWTDTSAGTVRTLSDDSALAVATGFSFPFGGTTYTSVYVGSNGIIGLGSAPTTYANTAIPNASAPNGFIAPFWDDLNPGAGGEIRTQTFGSAPNRRFVTTWKDVPVYGVTGGLTFQAVLHESGAIEFQYLDTIAGSTAYDNGASATVGVELADGLTGTQFSYLQTLEPSLSAVRCALPAATPAPSINATTLPEGTVGTAWSSTLQVTGGTSPFTWSTVGGAWPAGVTLAAGTGIASGTPTTAGTGSVTVRVTDAQARTADQTFAWTVRAPLTVSTASLPGGTVGTAYSATLAATGGTTPYTWAVTAGALPAGLSLNVATGAITGTPTATGTSSVTVRATDARGRTDSRTLGITVAAPAPVLSPQGLTLTKATVRTTSTLTASVKVVDQYGKAVSGAKVTGQWTIGTASVTAGTVSTNSSGNAVWKTNTPYVKGRVVTFCITSATKTGATSPSIRSCVSTTL